MEKQTAAYRTIPDEQLGPLHSSISLFLHRPPLLEDFVFDAADHALLAISYGVNMALTEEEGLINLLLKACTRSVMSASFGAARRYLGAAEGKRCIRLLLKIRYS